MVGDKEREKQQCMTRWVEVLCFQGTSTHDSLSIRPLAVVDKELDAPSEYNRRCLVVLGKIASQI